MTYRKLHIVVSVIALLGSLLGGLHAGEASGSSVTFTKIVVDGDPVPNAPGRRFFIPGGDYARPALDGDTVVFIANDGSAVMPLWAASISDGTIIRLVDGERRIPNGEGNFVELQRATIHSGTVVFWGSGMSIRGTDGSLIRQDGLYSVPAAGGQVTTLVNQSTAIPGGTGTFRGGFHHFDLDGDNVVFDYGQQVYTVPTTGGAVRSVTNNTVIREDGDCMTNFTLPNISGATVAMLVWNPGAIYTAPLSGLVGDEDSCYPPYLQATNATRIASQHVRVPPDDSRNFNPFGTGYFGADMGIGPLIDGDTIVFFGDTGDASRPDYLAGLYSSSQGRLTKLVDTNTPFPGGTGTFRFPAVYYSLSGGRVVFYGADSADPNNRQGLYHVPATGGPITKIIAIGDPLGDGRTLNAFLAAPIQHRSLSGNQVAFRVQFLDADRQTGTGIYVATITDPE